MSSAEKTSPQETRSAAVGAKRAKAFRHDLLRWYEAERRPMPWRATEDPYRIWISEVMLQQTRVDQAEPYYRRFVERFPTVQHLARADLDDVLLCWEGLGYYSRARNLHEAARRVVDEFDGMIPHAETDLRSLPGVGPYTAAAVLSIAYDQPRAALDGNAVRVLSRIFQVDGDVRKAKTKRRLASLADDLIDPECPGEFNQAVMELGATVCVPRSPDCGRCPVADFCASAAAGDPENYPVTARRPPVPHYHVAVGVIFNETGEVLIQKRPEDAMLGGLWEFPGGKQEADESIRDTCMRELAEELGVTIQVGDVFHTLSHAYSHFRITLHAFVGRIVDGEAPVQPGRIEWVAPPLLQNYAFPRANRRLIERLHAEFGADFA